MPIGALQERFVTQNSLLQEYASTLFNALIEQSQRVWMTPDLDGNTLQASGIAAGYSRTLIGEAFSDVMAQPAGTEGDAFSLQVQSDCLSTQERAYRLRKLTPVRASVQAAGRKNGHGSNSGIFSQILNYVQNAIVAGSNGYISTDKSGGELNLSQINSQQLDGSTAQLVMSGTSIEAGGIFAPASALTPLGITPANFSTRVQTVGSNPNTIVNNGLLAGVAP